MTNRRLGRLGNIIASDAVSFMPDGTTSRGAWLHSSTPGMLAQVTGARPPRTEPVAEVETAHYIPCFTQGTMVATLEGLCPVEQLCPGDWVLTRDNGPKQLCWVGQRWLNAHWFKANPKACPVLIRKGALGADLPERDIMVSPEHKMLIVQARAMELFGEREVLVSARHLVGFPGIEWAHVEEVVYLHIMFDRHEIIMANGAWSESYQADTPVLNAMDHQQRTEIFELLPQLNDTSGVMQAARLSLQQREAADLFH